MFPQSRNSTDPVRVTPSDILPDAVFSCVRNEPRESKLKCRLPVAICAHRFKNRCELCVSAKRKQHRSRTGHIKKVPFVLIGKRDFFIDVCVSKDALLENEVTLLMFSNKYHIILPFVNSLVPMRICHGIDMLIQLCLDRMSLTNCTLHNRYIQKPPMKWVH